MLQTVEAIIDQNGQVKLLEDIKVTKPRRVLITFLEIEPSVTVIETALLSEPALARDWNRPEEDEAWSHLQPEQ